MTATHMGRRRAPKHSAPEHKPEEFLQALPDLMFHMSRDGHLLDFKPAKDIAPFVPPEEFLGKNVADVLPAGVAADVLRYIEHALNTGEVQQYEYELPMEDAVHSYEARIVALGQDDVLAIVRDVTDDQARWRGSRQSAQKPQSSRYRLTKRELSVLRLVTVGMTDKEIARRLAISADTVRKHVGSVRTKMNAVSRTDASVRAVREGLII